MLHLRSAHPLLFCLCYPSSGITHISDFAGLIQICSLCKQYNNSKNCVLVGVGCWKKREPRYAGKQVLLMHATTLARKWQAEWQGGEIHVRIAALIPSDISPLVLGLHQHIFIEFRGVLPAEVLLHAAQLQAPAGRQNAADQRGGGGVSAGRGT